MPVFRTVLWKHFFFLLLKNFAMDTSYLSLALLWCFEPPNSLKLPKHKSCRKGNWEIYHKNDWASVEYEHPSKQSLVLPKECGGILFPKCFEKFHEVSTFLCCWASVLAVNEFLKSKESDGSSPRPLSAERRLTYHKQTISKNGTILLPAFQDGNTRFPNAISVF